MADADLALRTAEATRLRLAPGETLVVSPPAGCIWEVPLCEIIHRRLAEAVGDPARVIVFSAHIDLTVVDPPAETPEAFAAQLAADRPRYD